MRKIYVCENEIKEQILKDLKEFKPLKFITLGSLLEELTFTIDKEAITYLSVVKKEKPGVINSYLKYLKYYKLFDNSAKCQFLLKIKEEISQYIKHNVFTYPLDTEFTFIGYNEKDKDLKYVISLLKEKKYVNIHHPETKNQIAVKHNVYMFEQVIDESRYIFNRIKNLLDNGVNIRNIKIANYNNDYDFNFIRLSQYYQIPINFKNENNISYKNICKDFIKLLQVKEEFNEILEEINNNYYESKYINLFINVINDYNLSKYKPSNTIEIFKYEFSKASFDTIKYDNAIELIDILKYNPNENEHIFFLGFNSLTTPNLLQDDGYLPDNVLKRLGINTSRLSNTINKEILISKLNRKTNYVITYCKKTPFNSFLHSNLVKELDYELIDVIGKSKSFYENDNLIKKEIDIDENLLNFNEKEDVIQLAHLMDLERKYSTIERDYHKDVYDFDYNKYNNEELNKFKGIKKELLEKYLPKTITLSSSSLDKYYKCPFYYLMNNILKLDLFESNLSNRIGNYVHALLQKKYEGLDIENSDVDKEIRELVHINAKVELTAKDQFFYNLVKEMTLEMIKFIDEFKEMSNLKIEQCELEDNIVLDNGKLNFTGTIDKLIYTPSDNITNLKSYAILDYKTYEIKLNFDYLEYGFSMQLPIYLYLAKNGRKLKPFLEDDTMIGLFYQTLDIKKFTKDARHLKDMISKFKLNGKYRVGKAPSSKYCTVHKSRELTDDDEKYLIELIEKLIFDAYEAIRKGEFIINPKKDKTFNDLSCEYCNFKDTCYKRNKNYTVLKPKKKEIAENGME